MTPQPLRGDQSTRTSAQAAAPAAGRVQLPPGLVERIGPLEADLVSLHRTDFSTPEARMQAVRQWQTANAVALKAELDARSEAQRPEREQREAEARARLETTLDAQVAAGQIGSLEAEFIKLARAAYDSPEQRRAAIAQWQSQKGAAFQAEMDARRASDAPRRDALQAEAYAQRQQQIAAALASGRMGPREAELLQLSQNPDPNPAARQEAMRSWMVDHGTEMNAELTTRRSGITAEPISPAGPADSSAP